MTQNAELRRCALLSFPSVHQECQADLRARDRRAEEESTHREHAP